MAITDIIKAALFTPIRPQAGEPAWGLTLCLWGGPGTGKTAQISDIIDGYQLPFEVLSPGERGDGAFGVTPVPQGNMITYPPPAWVAELAAGGVVFLDEVNQAPPPLQPAIMGITLARRVGGYYLGGRCRTICAANPPDIAASGWEFAPPVANRMGHLNWPAPDASDWADWLLGSDHDDGHKSTPAKDEEARVMAAWSVPWAQAAGLVAGFLRARPELLNKMPQLGSSDLGRAWPSSRTWEMAARAYASSLVHRLEESDSEEFVGSFVGAGAASELYSYSTKLDLPNPAEVLDGKVKFKHEETRLDRTAAVLGSCAALVCAPKAEKQKARAEALWTIISDKALIEGAADVALPAAKKLVAARLHTSKAALQVLARFHPILEAAGVRYDPNAKDDE